MRAGAAEREALRGAAGDTRVRGNPRELEGCSIRRHSGGACAARGSWVRVFGVPGWWVSVGEGALGVHL